MARRKNSTRFDLHEALGRWSFEHGVVCTYTFDPRFFEDYCLERLASLSHNGNLTVMLDRGVYEKILTGPESYRPKRANLRYLLHPVAVARGLFHPKIFLFASPNRGRLIVGSANTTRPGITSNAELVGCYDYEAGKAEDFLPLFRAAFSFLAEAARRWPAEQLTRNVEDMLGEAPWLAAAEDDEPAGDFTLLHNLDAPLWDQIRAGIAAPADAVHVVSRYFDRDPSILGRVVKDLQPRKIRIYTQNGVTNMTPAWLEHDSFKSGLTEIMLGSYADDAQYAQPLHGKGIIIEQGGERVFAFGSANFTSPALLKTASNGNVETLLLLRPACNKSLDPGTMFDPCGGAVMLGRESALVSARADNEDFRREGHFIELGEVFMADKVLSIEAEVPGGISNLRVSLTSTSDFKAAFPLSSEFENTYTCALPEEVAHRLDRVSTTARLTGVLPDGVEVDSNPVLVTNLLVINTDQPVRRERHIRAAQQSAAQFFTVLMDLLRGQDEQAMLTFLNYCDIPVTLEPRSRLFRGQKPVWDGGAGMRSLGERNLKVYTTLHGAALGFFDRHYKRLLRHARELEADGVANFLHIFLAMGSVLRAQMERLAQGLEGRSAPLETREWFDIRTHVDTYFSRFRQMTDCLADEYLTPLLRYYEADELRERFAPDLQPLHDLYADMLGFRERIERLRTTNLYFRGSGGDKRTPSYFDCVLSEANWPKYERATAERLTRVDRAVA
jgi:hypothetical protein